MKTIILSIFSLCLLCLGLSVAAPTAYAQIVDDESERCVPSEDLEESPYIQLVTKKDGLACARTAAFYNVVHLSLCQYDDADAPKSVAISFHSKSLYPKIKKAVEKNRNAGAASECTIQLSDGDTLWSTCRVSVEGGDEIELVIRLKDGISTYLRQDILRVKVLGQTVDFSASQALNIRTSSLLDYLYGALLPGSTTYPIREELLSPRAVTLSELIRYPLAGGQVKELSNFSIEADDWERQLDGAVDLREAYEAVRLHLDDLHCTLETGSDDEPTEILCRHNRGYHVMLDGAKVTKAVVREYEPPEGVDVAARRFMYLYSVVDRTMTPDSAHKRLGSYAKELRALGCKVELGKNDVGLTATKNDRTAEIRYEVETHTLTISVMPAMPHGA